MKAGDFVVYTGSDEDQVRWGNCADPRAVLQVGGTYVVSEIDVHSWHTKLHIEGVTGAFNSVCFEELEV